MEENLILVEGVEPTPLFPQEDDYRAFRESFEEVMAAWYQSRPAPDYQDDQPRFGHLFLCAH